MSIENSVHTILVENMQRLRDQKGWNKSDLARHSGVDASHISNIENGKKHISLELTEKIAEALGVEPYELIRKYDVTQLDLAEKLVMIRELHPIKQQAIEQMVNAFLRESLY